MKMNPYEYEHSRTLRRLGAECAVLLKSNGAFPLSAPGPLALYGSGARRTIKGGTGSGEVNSRFYVTAEQGLKTAGFTITTGNWLDRYDEIYEEAHREFIRSLKRQARKHHTLAVLESMGAVMPEPEYDLPLNANAPGMEYDLPLSTEDHPLPFAEDMPEAGRTSNGSGSSNHSSAAQSTSSADRAADTAVYVLSRISGEGSDRKPVHGDILLTNTEIRDILELNRTYKNFLLVLNVGGVVDLSPVAEASNILLLGQLGVMTGFILADLILGRSFPSGKLATTWSAWEDYPQIGSFGERDDTRYREGIYVGYRYFDSVGKKPLFPFGYGLGYTEFQITDVNTEIEGEEVTVSAAVTNIGNAAGREVLQLYVSVPGGRLDQPSQTLAAFAKTRTLKPGETEQLLLPFRLRDISSYDTEIAAWILEGGDYILRLGTSSADTAPAAILRLDRETMVRICKNALGTPDFKDWKPETTARNCRDIPGTPDFEGSEAAAPEMELPGVPVFAIEASGITAEQVNYDLPHDIDPKILSLSDEELAYLNIGAFDPRMGSLSVIGNASQSVAGAAGETVNILKDKGIPTLVMADGPAGLRLSRRYTVDEKGVHALGESLPESMAELLPGGVAWVMKQMSRLQKRDGEVHTQYCTAIPIGTDIAQSWNPALAEACGDIVGDEMERFGIHLWLAPALNIHRDIRCGRNFEYFSEDPLISGIFAAAITKGVQKHPGCGTTIKHFAANNQETNRYNSNSLVSERTMREIYLRGFEIAVKESQPRALMTSYNLLNSTHTSERRDLLEDILRAEFGYRGIVMTDWIIGAVSGKNSKYPGPVASKIAAAGNDLTMPGGKGDFNAILQGLKNGTVSRTQLQINATRVYRMAKELTDSEGAMNR